MEHVEDRGQLGEQASDLAGCIPVSTNADPAFSQSRELNLRCLKAFNRLAEDVHPCLSYLKGRACLPVDLLVYLLERRRQHTMTAYLTCRLFHLRFHPDRTRVTRTHRYLSINDSFIPRIRSLSLSSPLQTILTCHHMSCI
jgi:hypothetical protein